MNFAFFGLMIFALIAAVMSVACPAPFKEQGRQCVVDRTIKGECPRGSTYKINVNKCVYGA